MNHQQLDELYIVWLYSQVADSEITDPAFTHWKFVRALFTREFAWVVPDDENRAEDGKELRREFVYGESLKDVDPDWTEMGCSVMELMVGLSRQLAFQADGEPHYWFWKLVTNLGLDIEGCSDDGPFPEDEIEQALDRVLFRTYDKDGTGGFFPLRNPHRNQRKLGLWYQLGAYVLEQSE